MCGLDAWRLLNTRDPVELAVLAAVLERAQELSEERDERLAVRIINALAKALNGGR